MGVKGGMDKVHEAPDDLQAEYWLMFSECVLSDITIETENDTTPAHRCVLATMSPVFKAMFSNDMQEQTSSVVKLPDISTDALRVLLQLIYCGSAGVDHESLRKHCLEVFRACHKYSLSQSRKQACIAAVISSINLSNCRDIMETAYTYDAIELSEACKSFIVENLQALPKFMGTIICTLNLVTLNSSIYSKTAEVHPMKVWSAGTIDNIKADIKNVLQCCERARLHIRVYLKAGSWIDFDDNAKISDILESLSDSDTRITVEVFHRHSREYYGMLKLGPEFVDECDQ